MRRCIRLLLVSISPRSSSWNVHETNTDSCALMINEPGHERPETRVTVRRQAGVNEATNAGCRRLLRKSLLRLLLVGRVSLRQRPAPAITPAAHRLDPSLSGSERLQHRA